MAEIPRRKVYLQGTAYGSWQVIDHVTGTELQFVQFDTEFPNLARDLGADIPGEPVWIDQIALAIRWLDAHKWSILSPYDIWGDYPEVFELDPDDLEKGRYYG